MIEVGSTIEHVVSGLKGFVINKERRPAPVVEVKWLDGQTSWLPESLIRVSGVVEIPPVPNKTSMGRTTPGYLVKLRQSRRATGEEQKTWAEWRKKKQAEAEQERLGNYLGSLNGKRKKSRHLAQKAVRRFNRENN
jgi:hypothetical protein